MEAIEQGERSSRSAVLEEAKRAVSGTRIYDATASEVRSMDIDAIRTLKSQPARRYLDAEMVREVLLARGRDHRHICDRMAVVREVMRDLGLDLDAAPACTCGAKDSSKPETLQAAHYAGCPTAHTKGGR